MTVKTQKARVVMEEDENTQGKSFSSQSKKGLSDTEGSSDQDIDEESLELLNEGWADSIAKILKTNKPKKKKTLVLSKAKKLTDLKKKIVKTESYEISTADGNVKKEEIVIEDKGIEHNEPPRKKKKDLPNLRAKPNILEKDRERTLQKIATKGVVQLFNAVKMQQKNISKQLEEAGPLEVRKEKVLKNIDKRAFLDVLMGEKSCKVDEEKVASKENRNKQATWNVLRDDFMMSNKMKDWDKELEDEDEQQMEIDDENIESD